MLLPLGGFGGTVAKTATSPLERIRVLAQTGGGEKGIRATASAIMEAEGVKGFWRGNFTNCLRIFPAKGVLFACNDVYKDLLRQVFRFKGPDPKILAFGSGACAGITACILTYPLDFARTRLAGVTGRDIGLGGVLREAIKENGYKSLYRGCWPTILGAVPYEGIKFGVYGYFSENGANEMTVQSKMFYGALSGVTAGVFVYPNDTVRKIMQISGSQGDHHGQRLYSSFLDCYRTTYRKGGLGRFYHGALPYLLRSVPNAAIQFSVYESLKTMVIKKHRSGDFS
eukprot:g6454.t1